MPDNRATPRPWPCGLLISVYASTSLFMIFKNEVVVLFPGLNLFGSKVGDGSDVSFGGVTI